MRNLSLAVDGHTVTAQVLSSTATATCGPGGPSVSGAAVIASLVVDGTPITVSGTPNQTVMVGPVTVVLNEQTSSVSASMGDITVTALHVVLPRGTAGWRVASAAPEVAG